MLINDTFITVIKSINTLAMDLAKDPTFNMPKERIKIIKDCAKQSTNKRQFKKLVKEQTGYTNVGYKECPLCSMIEATVKFN